MPIKQTRTIQEIKRKKIFYRSNSYLLLFVGKKRIVIEGNILSSILFFLFTFPSDLFSGYSEFRIDYLTFLSVEFKRNWKFCATFSFSMEMLIELGISRSNQTLLNCTAWKQTDEKCCRSEKNKKRGWIRMMVFDIPKRKRNKIQWERKGNSSLWEIIWNWILCRFYDMFAWFLELYWLKGDKASIV